MTLAEICILVAVALWLGAIGLAKGLGWRQYDNANPRSGDFYRSGWRARALGAHQNSLEALPFFIGAVLLAEFRQAPQGLVDGLAGAFVVARAVYLGVYLADRPLLRSTIWTVGLTINIALFLTPLAAR